MNRLPPGPGSFSRRYFSAGVVPAPQEIMKLAEKYGDTFRVPYITGPVTYTGNPEALRAIYTADPAGFEVWGVKATVPIFGSGSVAVTGGEQHRRDRKLLWSALQGSMREFGPKIAAVTRRLSDRWEAGQPFSMLASTQSITLDVILQVIFGIEDSQRLQRTRVAVRELIASLNPLLFLFPALRRNFGGVGPWARNCRAVAGLNAILSEEIRDRKTRKQEDTSVLSRMMSACYDDGSVASESEMLDQLRGLLFAGHETTGTVLAWIFYRIAREPKIYERLLSELDALGSDPEPHLYTELPYLEAVCLEGCRLYPPVLDPARIPRAPFQLLDYSIPAGEAIRPCPLILHAREDLFPEPDVFRPERFLERKFSSFEFISFGGGARRCLGGAFALYEMKLVLATVLKSCRLELAGHYDLRHVRRGATFGPEGTVPMLFRRRPALARRGYRISPPVEASL